MTARTTPYREALLQNLADPQEAKAYLNAVLEDYPDGFPKALRNVAQARQMSQLAVDAGVKRETLYRSLSENGNPTYDTLTSVLGALGLKLTVGLQTRVRGKARRAPATPREIAS
jgi:probable addiction module antidote protein